MGVRGVHLDTITVRLAVSNTLSHHVTNKMEAYIKHSFALFFLLVTCFSNVSCTRYEPNWESLDSRPLPAWYDESKIGIFIHWGVFSVPSFRSEWFWKDWIQDKAPDCVSFMKENYKPDFTYADFAKEFTAEFYDPNQWADIFNASGARYIFPGEPL